VTATVVTLPARRRGRPSNAALSDRVDRQVRLLAAAREERVALRAECRTLAGEVRAAGRLIEYAIVADRPDIALHVAGSLVALADRHERQRGGETA
jgi:hypothetical protein